MVEYGSGLFYGTTKRRFPSASQFTSSSISQILSLPSELDIGPSLDAPKLKINHHFDKDVILLSEFSEIEGPIPLLCIPEHVPSGIDLNEFSLQLMSTDYQNMGFCGGSFFVAKDTCLLQEDAFKEQYFYVHYFTLYDVRARGFVRPMCLAYLTREPQKLRKYFTEIHKLFLKTTEYLKISNLELFCAEMKLRIEDLNFTKRRFIQVHKHFPRDDNELQSTAFEKQSLTPQKKQFYTCGGDMPTTLSADSVHSITSGGTQTLLHSSSPSEPSRLSSQIRSEFKPNLNLSPVSNNRFESFTFKGSESPKETLIELSFSSDSSTSTVKSSSFEVASLNLTSFMLKKQMEQAMNSSDEYSILQHTSLDTLAAQLLDCQNIFDVSQKYLGNSTVRNELQDFLKELKKTPQSPLSIALQEMNLFKIMDCDNDASTQPTLFVAALMYRNFKNMRQIKHVCGIGYVAALSSLLGIYEKYSKPTLTLHFERLDKELEDDPFRSLFIGKLPVINFGSSYHSSIYEKSLNLSNINFDKIIKLLSIDLSKLSTPDSEYVDAFSVFNLDEVAVGVDCLSGFNDETDPVPITEGISSFEEDIAVPFFHPPISSEVKIKDSKHPPTSLGNSTGSIGSWSSTTTKDYNNLDQFEHEDDEDSVFEEENFDCKEFVTTFQDIDKRMDICRTFHLSAVLQQFCGVSQCIIQSILSGRPMIIAGPEYLKSVVILYTKALSTILPCKANIVPPVLKWHTGTITSHHIDLYKIIGICIPERLHLQDLMSVTTLNQVTVLNIETGHISGVAYSGSLLHKGDQLSRRHFKYDITLQAILQAILIQLGMKAYLLHHLKITTTRSENDILKGIGIPRGDWTIVQHLAHIVEEQMKPINKS